VSRLCCRVSEHVFMYGASLTSSALDIGMTGCGGFITITCNYANATHFQILSLVNDVEYLLNLSISLGRGKESNCDAFSNCE
jgi:hypothetical protein